MVHLIDKAALVAEIEKLVDKGKYHEEFDCAYRDGNNGALYALKDKLDTLEVKEVDLEKSISDWLFEGFPNEDELIDYIKETAKHFFELGLKVQHNNWKVVDNTNLPQGDRTKIYCVFTKDRYILATVINHPQDEDLLQWKCTEFPFHRYDMCEGDKYMQIV